ncbi:MAG: hypothetical protein ACLSD6_08195 [Clostridium sp.]
MGEANVTLKVGKVKLKKNRDYTLVPEQSSNRKSLGCYREWAILPERKLLPKIVPQTPKIQKLKKNKKSFAITYSSGKMVHGYRMEVSTASSRCENTEIYIERKPF